MVPQEEILNRAAKISATNSSHEATEHLVLTLRDCGYLVGYLDAFPDGKIDLGILMGLPRPVGLWAKFDIASIGNPFDDATILGYRFRKLGLLTNNTAYTEFYVTSAGKLCGLAIQMSSILDLKETLSKVYVE